MSDQAIRRNTLGQGHIDLSTWFGLSYASYLTLPRVLMECMPDEWQGRMAALLREYDDAWPNWPDGMDTRVQITMRGRLVKTPEWIINYRRPQYSEIEALQAEASNE